MRQILSSEVAAPIRDVCKNCKEMGDLFEAMEKRRTDLQLAIMQTRARIAEVKATLRQIECYLPG